jgi:hypothetical protein
MATARLSETTGKGFMRSCSSQNLTISAHCVSSANVQELSEASDQPIQKPDLALKDSLSGIAQ